jgi:penicillin amidase
LKKFSVALIVLVASAAIGVWVMLHGSLPALDGTIEAPGLAAPVEIERDHFGVPTLHATTRSDLAYATGFVHAQDRFFQMDLLRRAAAGRLAELLGPGLVETDRRLRVHGFERVAEEVIEALPSAHRAVLDAYAAGVNAALSSLRVRPPEYLLLRVAPRAWTSADSILAAHAMFLDLNDSTGHREIQRALLEASLPEAVVEFLDPPGTSWDAPLVGDAFAAVPIPPRDLIDLRDVPESVAQASNVPLESRFDGVSVGSNNWAVAGTHTASGAAIVANDMHLGLRIPNVWYRARLIVTQGGRTDLDLAGVTLPGLPVLIAGSNGHVAWGYTNSYGDWTDVVRIEPDPADANRYLVGDGSRPYDVRTEQIRASGAEDPASVTIRTTIWGPVIGELEGRPIALAWTAHSARAVNLRHLDLEQATTVDAALEIANAIGAPVQNFVAVDSAGNIGWTLMGQVPIRAGYDPALPSSWRDPHAGWKGWQEPRAYPRVVNPPTGRIWTANARVLDETGMSFAGNGGYDRGARASQIRDRLISIDQATVADMAAIQLDDQARFLERWHALLLALLDSAAVEAKPERGVARDFVAGWSGRAAIDDVGFRIVRAFRLSVVNTVYESLIASARAEHPAFRFEPSAQFEGSLWQLVSERPDHLLDSRYSSWRDLLLDAYDRSLAELEATCGKLPACTWGERNRLTMSHPIARAVPLLARWLDMPDTPLPGDGDMPRVQGPAFGASERFAVSPGREAEGYFQMPGGQSGHPLSPFYRAGHEQWIDGDTAPFLPGETRHRLQIEPSPAP